MRNTTVVRLSEKQTARYSDSDMMQEIPFIKCVTKPQLLYTPLSYVTTNYNTIVVKRGFAGTHVKRERWSIRVQQFGDLYFVLM